jgi:hypothetical protein
MYIVPKSVQSNPHDRSLQIYQLLHTSAALTYPQIFSLGIHSVLVEWKQSRKYENQYEMLHKSRSSIYNVTAQKMLTRINCIKQLIQW